MVEYLCAESDLSPTPHPTKCDLPLSLQHISGSNLDSLKSQNDCFPHVAER